MPPSSDTPDSRALQQVLQELAATIRRLPEDQQLDAFLASCTSLLATLHHATIVDTLRELRLRFPQDDNEVLTLIEGHLALRELLAS
jgi:hypothetical protein